MSGAQRAFAWLSRAIRKGKLVEPRWLTRHQGYNRAMRGAMGLRR